jgi:hypothetical protein
MMRRGLLKDTWKFTLCGKKSRQDPSAIHTTFAYAKYNYLFFQNKHGTVFDIMLLAPASTTSLRIKYQSRPI